MRIVCGPDYPQKPLEVSFNTKISIPSVNNYGKVDNLNVLKQWKAGVEF